MRKAEVDRELTALESEWLDLQETLEALPWRRAEDNAG
jgi:hypothetical protein